jgi:hypothetical protein
MDHGHSFHPKIPNNPGTAGTHAGGSLSSIILLNCGILSRGHLREGPADVFCWATGAKEEG